MRTDIRTNITKFALLIGGVLAYFFIVQAQSAFAHTADEHSEYTYTAQPGDSLTLFARDAINKYAAEHDSELSAAQRVYAETRIVQKLGAELLNVGQKVTIKGEAVADAVKRAENLSADQRAAWQPYAVVADFSEEALRTPVGVDSEAAAETENETARDRSTSNDRSTERERANQNEVRNENEADDGSWYTNVFTWVLIVAVAIIAWSLFASRKEEMKK